MDTLILKKIKDKLRQDFPDEWIEKSSITHKEFRGDSYVVVSHEITHRYYDFKNGEPKLIEETEIPDEIKKLFLSTSNVYSEEEYDPLNEPCRNSFIYEDLVKRGELLGEEKLKSLGLSKTK